MPDGSLIIGAAGIYPGVSMEHYLACEAVAAHDLWNLEKFCPRYAYVRHPLCPDPEPGRDTEALSIGELAHTLILEGVAATAARFAVKPDGLRANSTAGKEWLASIGDKRVITEADLEAARFWAAAIAADKTAADALASCDAEVTMLAKDSETGVAIKSRPDAMRANLVVNIKTAASAKPAFWASDARKYGYHVSQAMTALVLKELGIDPRTRPYVFLVIEKAKRHPIIETYTLPDNLVQEGELIVRKSLRRWAACIEANDWPGYAGKPHEVPLPFGTMQSIERLQQEIYG